ncbi:hypothetical protein AGABI1DRAFT_115044, partial [Agaricus bisporus var. burnettii JB137-S8]
SGWVGAWYCLHQQCLLNVLKLSHDGCRVYGRQSTTTFLDGGKRTPSIPTCRRDAVLDLDTAWTLSWTTYPHGLFLCYSLCQHLYTFKLAN